MLNENRKITNHKFSAGDEVRLSKKKGTFEKGYETNFTDEIFVVGKVVEKGEGPMFQLRDLDGEIITGLFYGEELSKVVPEERTYKRVQKVLRKRKHKGKDQYLIRWSGFSSAHDSWKNVSDTELI